MLRTSAFISTIPVLQGLLLARLVDHDDAALAARHCTVHADQIALCIDHHHFQVLGGHAVAAQMPGAAGTAIDAAWGGAGRVRTRGSVAVGGAMCRVHAVEMVALND